MAHIVSCALRISTLTLCLAALYPATAFPQAASDVSSAATTAAAQAAYVYVGTTKGVYLYNAASNGSLSLVSGSPFSIAGSAVGSNGKYFFSLGPSFLRSYPVASNGAIKGQASQINTQLYSGSECGTAQGAVLDHTGQDVYVQLYGDQTGRDQVLARRSRASKFPVPERSPSWEQHSSQQRANPASGLPPL